MTQSVGTLTRLWRFPVKSMGGEAFEAGDVTAAGLAGDRAHALIDTETGKVVSGKSVKHFPQVMECRAAYVEAPRADAPLPPVEITLADATRVRSDDPDRDRALSAFFGRSVTLASQAPDGFTIDIAHPDLSHPAEDEQPETIKVQSIRAQKVGAALFAELGIPSPVPETSFFDGFPITVLTTQTLETLQALAPDSIFDERRFRMNLIVDTGLEGFVENDWVERTLQVGNALRLHIALPDPRCIMTNLAQEGLPRDPMILRTMAQHNRIEVAGSARPCAGVYAVVEASGLVRVGDPVTVI